MIEITEKDGKLWFFVQVRPGAKREGIAGEIDGAVKLEVTAPPHEGKANAAVIKLIAASLGVAKSKVEIVSGEKSKKKRIKVEGVERDDVLKLIP